MTSDGRRGEAREQGAPSGSTTARDPDTASVAESVLAGLVAKGLGALREAGAGRDDGAVSPTVDVAAPLRESDPVPLLEWVVFGLPLHCDEDPPDWPERKLAELGPEEGALGDYLEHLPPGERLAKLLAAIDLDKVDDFSLVEVVAAFKRMEAWSAGRAARAAAALAERDALNPTWPGSLPGRTRGECVAGQELAMRLRVSRWSAVRMTACGRAFGGMFQPTGDALELGLIDFPRAQAIVTTLEGMPGEVAMAAQWEVLDRAPGRTLRQVHQDLAQAVIAADPEAADDRHRAARQQRCVHRPRALPDGMARVSAVLAAGDAIALDTALEAAARAAKNNGDRRTLDQLRADSLALMGHTALELGHIGPHAAGPCTCGCAARDSKAPGAADARTPDATAPGARPPDVSPSEARTPDATAPGAAEARTPDVTAPGARPPDVSPPGATGPGPSDASAPSSSPAPPRPADGPPRPGHRLSGCALPTIRLGMLGGGRADVRVTVPLSVLLPGPRDPQATALDRDPEPVAELDGYGPIPPVVARALALGGAWRRLVTDPTGTQVLDVGRTRYQPTAAITDHVRERDRTCILPACSAPARTADLDHIHEWQHGGETSAANLGPMCTSGHRVKTIGAYTVAYATDRSYAWTTPTGHGYLRRPDGTTCTLPHRTAQALRAAGLQAARHHRHLHPAAVDAVLAEVAAGTDTTGRWNPPPGAPRSAFTWPGAHEGPTWADDDPPF